MLVTVDIVAQSHHELFQSCQIIHMRKLSLITFEVNSVIVSNPRQLMILSTRPAPRENSLTLALTARHNSDDFVQFALLKVRIECIRWQSVSGHRSHFGSRYTLGCRSLRRSFCMGSIPARVFFSFRVICLRAMLLQIV